MNPLGRDDVRQLVEREDRIVTTGAQLESFLASEETVVRL
jgi:hypothetical protein